MDVQSDERLLRNIEGFLIELVCNVESMDEVNLLAEVLSFDGDTSLLSGLWSLVCWKGNDQNFPGLFPNFFKLGDGRVAMSEGHLTRDSPSCLETG